MQKPKLILKTRHGDGVYTTEPIPCNEKIFQFTGPIVDMDDVSNECMSSPKDDRYIQVGPHTLMGPSGDLDDYFNHACNPNAGVKQIGETWWLVAIRDINANEEITWDYSTTMYNDDWKMVCACGANNCRNIIQEYKYLSPDLKNHYEHLGIVPKYNLM